MRARFLTAAFCLAWGCAVSIVVSIAASQILLALGLIALLLSRATLRLPPFWLPVVLFFIATVAAMLASDHPLRGLPQIRKFYVFLIVVLVYNTFRTIAQIRSLVLAWAAVASLSAVAGLFQFLRLLRRADPAQLRDYGYFLYNRITGFSSHWMTFGGEVMIVLLALVSFLFLSADRKGKIFGAICVPILFLALVLGLTRSIFLLGLPLGATYLIWQWKRWLLLPVPPLLLAAFLLAPMEVRERVLSVTEPHRGMDSNTQRVVSMRTGWAMVRAHPWLGLGPEEVAPQFQEYVPADIPRPLPPGWYGHLHNIYLQYAAERGVSAMLIMMWLIGTVLWRCLRDLRTAAPDRRFVLHAAIAVIVAVLAEGLFEHNLGDSEILTLFLTMLTLPFIGKSGRSPRNSTAILATTTGLASQTRPVHAIRRAIRRLAPTANAS